MAKAPSGAQNGKTSRFDGEPLLMNKKKVTDLLSSLEAASEAWRRKRPLPDGFIEGIANWPKDALLGGESLKAQKEQWNIWLWGFSYAKKIGHASAGEVERAALASPNFMATWASAAALAGLGQPNHSDVWAIGIEAIKILPEEIQRAIKLRNFTMAAMDWETEIPWGADPQFGAQMTEAERQATLSSWACLGQESGEEAVDAQEALDAVECGGIALANLQRWRLVDPEHYPKMLEHMLMDRGFYRTGHSETAARATALLRQMDAAQRVAFFDASRRDPADDEKTWLDAVSDHKRQAVYPSAWEEAVRLARSASEAASLEKAARDGHAAGQSGPTEEAQRHAASAAKGRRL